MLLTPEEITIDTLDDVDAEWRETRLRNLVRDEVIDLGREFNTMKANLSWLETRCMLRARKLAMLGFPKKEIQALFDVDRATVNRWTKGMF